MGKTKASKARSDAKVPYDARSDLDKLQSQWNKLSGLHLRDESSAAIVRCATAAEVAANYAVRHEFQQRSQFEAEAVNQLLFWANGLRGKIERLFVPLRFAESKLKDETAKRLIKSAEKINKVRNEIAHQGRFSNPSEAKRVIAEAKSFIDTIVGLSVPGFDIQDRVRTPKRPGRSNKSRTR